MLEEFIANIKSGGLARNNRYTVSMTPPTLTEPNNLRKILLFCDQAQLPGVNYATVQNRSYGEFRETPYERLYDTANLSFLVDTDMHVKFLFDTWMYSIQDFKTKQFNFYNSYVTDLTITVEDVENNAKYQVVLYEAYPKAIGTVQLDYASKDVMKLNVTMQYRNWESFLLKDSVEQLDTPIDTSMYQDDFIQFQQQYAALFGDPVGSGVDNSAQDGGAVVPTDVFEITSSLG